MPIGFSNPQYRNTHCQRFRMPAVFSNPLYKNTHSHEGTLICVGVGVWPPTLMAPPCSEVMAGTVTGAIAGTAVPFVSGQAGFVAFVPDQANTAGGHQTFWRCSRSTKGKSSQLLQSRVYLEVSWVYVRACLAARAGRRWRSTTCHPRCRCTASGSARLQASAGHSKPLAHLPGLSRALCTCPRSSQGSMCAMLDSQVHMRMLLPFIAFSKHAHTTPQHMMDSV